MTIEQVVPAEGFEYYRDKYWNDFEVVVRLLNERATGDRSTSWMEHLRDTYGPFRHALVLNCGSGWVERELLERGVIESALGVDVSPDLVAVARDAARQHGTPLRYLELDTNGADFPDEDFDLVVNHAAMHHVAYIDRVTRRLCELLTPDGVFVSWDYVGPHRNQYTARQWEAAWEVNERLPADVRQTMAYPHLPTMLASDPTEAVHSELIVPTIERYFRVEHRRDLGGAIGYLLLTHNASLHALPPEESEPHVREVMTADAELIEDHPGSTLFTYIVARPDPASLDDPGRLATWTSDEESRERAAAANGGRYYPRTVIAALTEAAEASRPTRDANDPATTAEVLARTPGRTLVRVLAARLRARVAATLARFAPWRRSGRFSSRTP